MKDRTAQEAAQYLLERKVPENVLRGFNADYGLTLTLGCTFFDALVFAYRKRAAEGDTAAKEAGYSEKTARAQGARLLTNVDVQQYIQQLQDKLAAGRIASMVQIRAFWSDTVRDSGARLADRLKASELLARAAGAFLHLQQDPDGGGIIAAGEMDGGTDVVIYVPQMLREEDCQVMDDEQMG